MKVIVLVTDNDLTDPAVFSSVEAVEKYWKEHDFDTSTDDHELMIVALKEGKSFSDAYSYIGWHEVKEP